MESERKSILLFLFKLINDLSDRAYQEKVWIKGGGPDGIDFDETVCFFSPDVNEVIVHYKDYGLTDEQYRRLKEFRDEFDAFCRGPALDYYLPQLFIDTPEWAKVMKMAKELYDYLDITEIEPRINREPLPR